MEKCTESPILFSQATMAPQELSQIVNSFKIIIVDFGLHAVIIFPHFQAHIAPLSPEN